jgi:hypothetical protein
MEMNVQTMHRFVDKGPTLREELVMKLQGLVEGATKSSLSGATRQIRHTGTYASQSLTTQQQNKATIRGHSALVSFLKSCCRCCDIALNYVVELPLPPRSCLCVV